MSASKGISRVAGVCGMAAPAVAFSCIFLAISLSPWFSWSANALSDLGVREAAAVFNSGLIAAGVLSMVFAAGLWIAFDGQAVGRTGVALFFVGSFALSCIGVFSEAAMAIHMLFSVMFFVLTPISLYLMGAGAVLTGSKRFGFFTIAAGVVAIIPWAFSWDGVAIPEFVSALAASVWSVAQGVRLCLGQVKR